MNENWDKNEFEKSPSGHGLGEDKWVSDEYLQYPEFFWSVSNAYIFISPAYAMMLVGSFHFCQRGIGMR